MAVRQCFHPPRHLPGDSQSAMFVLKKGKVLIFFVFGGAGFITGIYHMKVFFVALPLHLITLRILPLPFFVLPDEFMTLRAFLNHYYLLKLVCFYINVSSFYIFLLKNG